MQINALGQISSTAVRSKKSRTSADGSFIDVLEEDSGAEAKPSVSASVPLGQISSLLALQELPDATQGRSRGFRRAQDMLKGLEDLRLGILSGAISKSRLQQLGGIARQQREAIADPRIIGILDDIELRVEVELAKLELNRD